MSTSKISAAIRLADERTREKYAVFNVATDDYITVGELADLAVRVSDIPPGQTKYEFKGGDRGRRVILEHRLSRQRKPRSVAAVCSAFGSRRGRQSIPATLTNADLCARHFLPNASANDEGGCFLMGQVLTLVDR
jgi:hypothetical protein